MTVDFLVLKPDLMSKSSLTSLLWAKKVVMLDKPGQTVGKDPFEDFAETECEADGPVGVGIIRRFAGLGEGDNYGFVHAEGDSYGFFHASGTKVLL